MYLLALMSSDWKALPAGMLGSSRNAVFNIFCLSCYSIVIKSTLPLFVLLAKIPVGERLKIATLVFVSEGRAFAKYATKYSEYDNIELSQALKIADVLIDRRAALVFVDGADEQWQSLILAVKNNAATRRVPICFANDDRARRADAIACGADRALGWDELDSSVDQIISDMSRLPDPAILAQLACECAQALPELAKEGARAFNQGEFYRQHDLFEAQWVETAGPVRDLYRAILQVGVAYYQIERDNYRGALKMLQRSVQWLHPLPDSCQGIDVEQLRRDSYAVRAELQRLGPERLSEFDRGLLKKLRWHPVQSTDR